MDCWNYCCLTQANCHTLLPDGKFQKGKKKVSVHDVQEWSLRLRENKLSLDEFNIRKKQSQIQKMIGFTNEDQKEKEITEGLTLLTINKEKSIEESPKKQKKDPMPSGEWELNFGKVWFVRIGILMNIS